MLNTSIFLVPGKVQDLTVTPVDGYETEKLKVSWKKPDGGVDSYSVSLK